MTKLVARQPINMNALSGFSPLYSPGTASFSHREKDGFTATLGDTRLVVGGEGFGYLFGDPRPVGTITSVKVFFADELVYKLTGAKVSFRKFLDSENTEAIYLFFKGNDTLKGSWGDDFLTGREGKDTLLGRGGVDSLAGFAGKDILDGGAGGDTLNGGGGRDTYVFKADPTTGIDTIPKFQADEMIEIDQLVFGGLTAGTLPAGAFVLGAAAEDENDRIIYDPSTGALYHDPDGTGGREQVKFAQTQGGLDHITADNFLVI